MKNMHKLMVCIEGYIAIKLLTMWTYHPVMKKVIKWASMEAEKENTECIALFLELFNSVLRVSGKNDYKFNPCGIMCNEAGANFNAIEKVLEKDVLARTISCQWHFR